MNTTISSTTTTNGPTKNGMILLLTYAFEEGGPHHVHLLGNGVLEIRPYVRVRAVGDCDIFITLWVGL